MNRYIKEKIETIMPLSEMIVTWEEYRFTVLTESMIRLEYSPDKSFEDGPTKVVINRCFSKVDFELKETDESLEIITSKVRLHFQKEKGGFTSYNLSADVLGNFSSFHSNWIYGQEFDTLKGTARTLDEVDGAVPLEDGLMNKNGFSIIDDSQTVLIKEDGWIEPKTQQTSDIYFLGYGRDYLKTLEDYFHLTGHPPLIPRYALGNWWSRYYPYSEESYKELMNRFEEETIPFSVAVLDMDWHETDVPDEYGSGWTGYTWNKELFPDPAGFLEWLHESGVKTSLNLHPAHGVQPHEDAYEEMAAALGLDASSKQGIKFDITDPEFMQAYFTYLHHPHEDMGVDFWWIDWQQGSVSKLDGVDPLWVLNHYHYLDHGRDGKRPLIFSRYAGLGSHRYPIGFSGDSITTWDSFRFQPYFTSTASNVGYTWWSHDIGGHMRGKKDRELYIRWMQYGIFSPINRLHSTGGKYNGKEPWRYGLEAKIIVESFLRMRHKLIPYLYSMNVLTHTKGLPLVKPMYYDHPWDEKAYSVENQYYFGSELIVSPVTSKINSLLQRAHVKTWLPEGIWYDIFTEMHYKGGRFMDVYRPLETIPVFAKAGAIIPKNAVVENGADNPVSLELQVFSGASGNFTLYEDSGETQLFDGAVTNIDFKWHENTASDAELTINKPEGDLDCLPEERQYRIHMVGLQYSSEPEVYINGKSHSVLTEETDGGLCLVLPLLPAETDYQIILKEVNIRPNQVMKQIEKLLDEAQIDFDLKEEIDETIHNESDNQIVLGNLLALDLDTELVKAMSEILLAHPTSN